MSGITPILAGISAQLAPVGLGLGIASQVLGGVAARQENRALARSYETNASIALQQAQNQAAQEQDKYKHLAASQRASFGASGLDVNEGSPLDVLADTDAEGAVSAMQLLYGGRLEEANWKQRARDARASGRQALASGIAGGLGTALLGSARMGSGISDGITGSSLGRLHAGASAARIVKTGASLLR